MNTKTLIVRALLAPLAVVLSLGSVACDQPDSDSATFVFEVEELTEMAIDAGNEELAEYLLEDDSPSADASLPLADAEDAPNSFGQKTLAECLVDYCFFESSLEYSGQCILAQSPLGLEGVCVIVDPSPECMIWEYYGEFCNVIPGL